MRGNTYLDKLSDSELQAVYEGRWEDLSDAALQSVVDFENYEQRQSQSGNVLDPMGQGASLGASDEIAGAIGAVAGKILPESMGGLPPNTPMIDTYKGVRDQARNRYDAFNNRNPGTGFASEIAGGMLPGVLTSGATMPVTSAKVPQALEKAWPYMKASGTAAGGAGLYGWNQGESFDERMNNAWKGAVSGAVLGPAFKYGADTVTNKMAQRSARNQLHKVTPTIENVKQQAKDLYDASEGVGLVISQKSFSTLADDIQNALAKSGYHKKLQPGITDYLDEIATEVAAGKPVTLERLDQLRQIIAGAYTPNNPKQNMLVEMIKDKIDDYAENLGQSDLVAGGTSAVDMLVQARQLWSVKRKYDVLTEAMRKAESQASGVENGLRIQFRHILNNKKTFNKFSKAEQEMIKSVVDGNFTDNTLRALGRLAPTDGVTSHWLTSMLGSGGGYAAGGFAGAAGVPAIGYASQSAGRTATEKRAIDALEQVLRSKGPTMPYMKEQISRGYQGNTDPWAVALGFQFPGLIQGLLQEN